MISFDAERTLKNKMVISIFCDPVAQVQGAIRIGRKS